MQMKRDMGSDSLACCACTAQEQTLEASNHNLTIKFERNSDYHHEFSNISSTFGMFFSQLANFYAKIRVTHGLKNAR